MRKLAKILSENSAKNRKKIMRKFGEKIRECREKIEIMKNN